MDTDMAMVTAFLPMARSYGEFQDPGISGVPFLFMKKKVYATTYGINECLEKIIVVARSDGSGISKAS